MRWTKQPLGCPTHFALFAKSVGNLRTPSVGCPIHFALFAKWVGNLKALVTAAAVILLAAAGSSAAAQAPPAPTPRYVVVLDAAHGGDDSGGHSGDWNEKALTLALSVRLRSLLAARGISVVTTRESDTAIAPLRRAEIANHAGAQACISLHASLSGAGVHLYASSLPPAQRSTFLPWKTAQAAWVQRSLALAGVLNSALLHAGMSVNLGRTALPLVDSMACPAVAVEISPDSSPDRTSGQSPVDSLNDARYQARVTEALAAAIVQWRQQGSQMEAGQP